MRLDSLVIHSNDLGDVIGEFYGTPIREMSTIAVELREISDAQQRVRRSLGEPSPELVLLPGEVIKDQVIRRETAAEVVGDAFYEEQPEEQGIAELKETNYYD